MEAITLLQAENKDGRGVPVPFQAPRDGEVGALNRPSLCSAVGPQMSSSCRGRGCELSVPRAEAPRGRLSSDKRCVQGRWKVSHHGDGVVPVQVNLQRRCTLHINW